MAIPISYQALQLTKGTPQPVALSTIEKSASNQQKAKGTYKSMSSTWMVWNRDLLL